MDGPRLIQLLPDGSSKPFALEPRTTIGRHPTNVLQVHDREVSKEHAIIEVIGGEWQLRDLGSSNGSWVNNRRVSTLRLQNDDVVTFGATNFRFRVGADEQASFEPPPSFSPSTRGVTVVMSAPEMAAILASRRSDGIFRPAEEIRDPAVLRDDYEKLRIAHKFSKEIGLEREQDRLLEKILSFAFEVFAPDNGVILLQDPTSKELVVEAVRPADSQATLSGSVLQRVVETREAVLSADAGTDIRFSASESIIAHGIRSCMCVPLLVREQVRGVLFLDSRERSAFLDKDLNLLTGIAAQASLGLERLELARQIEAEAEARAHLSRFLSPALVEQAQKGQLDLKKGGSLTHVTVLFADIRGFTALSEKLGPQETIHLLNEYFESMVDAVFGHEGILDKFIGDALLAVWGAPLRRDDDASRALRCALEMQERLRGMNTGRTQAGKPQIGIGIGVNSGDAVVGNMGSSRRLEYTVIGDTVNLASRLCDLARSGETVASFGTMQETRDGFAVDVLPPAVVKGKSAAIPIFRVKQYRGGR